MKYIRFSQMPESVKTQYNKKMIDVLAFFDDFCEQHNLRYSLAYGSILGAVRHQGIIPWDYDIDTFMPRPDYNRFIELFKKIGSKEFQLLTPEDTDYYPEPFAKIGDTKTSLLKTKMFPVDYGIFIDIWPLDGGAEVESERSRDFIEYNKYLRIFRVFQSTRNIKELIHMFFHGLHKHVLFAIVGSPFRKQIKKHCLKKLYEISTRYPFEKSKYVIQYRDAYGFKKHVFLREWFDETEIVSFESIKVRIPKEYDAFLKHCYGNYMQLPPEDKRDDMHIVDYLNIDNRVAMKEILRQL